MIPIGIGVLTLWREAQVEHKVQLLDHDQAGGARVSAEALAATPLPDRAVPRAQLADALLRIRRAGPGPQQRQLLAQAERELAAATASRPWYGDAWIVVAYLRSVSADPASRMALIHAISRSYADDPYLRASAMWRVKTALTLWDDLDAVTRAHVVNEAVWLVRIDPSLFEPLTALTRESLAYRPFMAAYLGSREGDADITP